MKVETAISTNMAMCVKTFKADVVIFIGYVIMRLMSHLTDNL